MYRIFIIEDDRTIANAVKNHLEKWGFEARCAENFKDIMAEFSEFLMCYNKVVTPTHKVL